MIALTLWRSSHKPTCDGHCGMHDYPYTVQNPLTHEYMTVNNDEDLKALFISLANHEYPDWGSTLFALTQLCICYFRLRDQWVNDMIHRYYYCKQWNTQPYSGSYDDHPATWKDISEMISVQEQEVAACKCHEHNPRLNNA